MSLTPQDIQAKQFHVRFRGFDVEEVDGFLEQVAENFLMLIEENKALQFKNDTLVRELELLKKEEHSFKNAMISAQSIADGMLKKSREEADMLLAKTHEEIKKHKDNAIKEITELEIKVDQLRGTQSELQNDLRAVIDDYLDMIDNPSQTLAYDNESSPDRDDASPMTPSAALSDIKEDLSDLYEKIELPAEHPAAQDFSDNLSGVEGTIESGEIDISDEDNLAIELDDIETSMPNMNDDIMFTLDDPLDDEKTDGTK
jgi:cell division initiation protein